MAINVLVEYIMSIDHGLDFASKVNKEDFTLYHTFLDIPQDSPGFLGPSRNIIHMVCPPT
jgi:hypothetical protein